MTKEQYLIWLSSEDYMRIVYTFYTEKNKREDCKFDYNSFFMYFKVWLMRGSIDSESMIEKVIDFYNLKFQIYKVYSKEKELIGYY